MAAGNITKFHVDIGILETLNKYYGNKERITFMKEQLPGTNNSLHLRLLILGAFVLAVMGLIAYNLLDLQLFRHEELRQAAEEQQLRDVTITPNRGTIYDSNMKVLATSATVWTISVAPNNIKEDDREDVAEGLSEILEIDEDELLKKLENTGSAYELVKGKVDKPIADEVRTFATENQYYGIYLHEDSKRYYPYGDFLSTVIGFTGTDNQGLAGIEAYYDDELTGIPGRVVAARNSVGGALPYDYEEVYEAQDGNSLVLTIDETIQHFLEKHLEYAVIEHNVEARGVGIVMDVNTGAILAMATKNDYDPNAPFAIHDEEVIAAIEELPLAEQSTAVTAAQNEQWRNKAVSDLYEPGSVLKLLTASAALDSGKAVLEDTYYCSGSLTVGGHTMRCADTGGHIGSTQTFSHALVNSCNPAFILMGQQLGVETYYDYAEAFGMTEKTGIDISGEAFPIFHEEESMGEVELASTSFGQSVKVTPLQMITMISTIANGGQLVQPHIVDRILDVNGNIVETLSPEPKRQIISEEVSEELLNMMEIAVAGAEGYNSPGKNAYVMGYQVGGKSGTSQKLDEDGGESLRIASFGAVAPVDDPQIAVLIVLDEPHSSKSIYGYGGILAAPVVGLVMGETLPYLGIEPKYSEEEQAIVEIMLQNVEGMSTTDAQVALQRNGFESDVQGDGDLIISQFPAAGTILARGSTIILNTIDTEDPQLVTVPTVIGYNESAAARIIEAAGLNMKRTGATAGGTVEVTAQSIEPGERVPLGTPVTVTLEDHSLVD